MMYNEFVERVGMEVSSSEFEIINNMYMLADVDKDTFCKLWAKMNFARIKTAKEQKAKEEKEVKAIEYITKVYNKLSTKLNKDFMVNFNMLAIHVCGIIEIDEYCPLGHYVSTLDNSINEYWDKVAEKHI